MKELFGGTLDLGVVAQQALCRDIGDGDVAAVLAEHQVLAVRRIGYAAIAAARIRSERDVVLQDIAGVGVEYLDGLRRAHGEDGGGVSGGIGVQRDGLRADPDAEVDLCAGRGDDLATAHDPGAVRLRAGGVGRERHGLSTANTGTLSPAASRPASGRRRLISIYFESLFETLFWTLLLLPGLFITRLDNADRRHEDEELSLRPMARDKGQADRCG